MKELTIRRAQMSDADRLAECMDAAYAEYVAQIDDLPSMSEDCAKEIAENIVWVAEDGDAIVGGLVLVPCDGYMLLANVAVHPENRGAGIGQQLLRLAGTEAGKHGYTELRLNTHVDMTATVQLYMRNGWQRTSQKGNKISMKKCLPTNPG